MDKVVSDLKLIKATIFDSYFDQNNNGDNRAFNKLLVLQNLDEGLKETLVLLHSNYMAELETIKRYNYKALDKILDNNLDAYHAMSEKDKQLSSLFESLEKKQPKLSTSRVIMFITIMICITGFLTVMFYLFASDKEAGKMIMDLVKMFLDKVEPVNINPIPTGQ